MKREYASEDQATAVAKEALWLAFQAAGCPSGMGFLRDRNGVTKDDVWNNAYNNGDYAGGRHSVGLDVSANYVFGRMLKLRFHRTATTIDVPDTAPLGAYQAWCGQYKTYAVLFDAAEQLNGRQNDA